MKIALIQQHASPDRAANVERALGSARKAAADGANLIAFAELAFDPFYPQKPAEGGFPMALAETIPGPTTDAFAAIAKEFGCVVVLNIYEKAGDKTYDSSPVIDAGGSILGTTRMLHIAEMPCFHEQSYYAPGDNGVPVYDTAAGKVGVAICYDRHYPEVMRGLGLRGAEVVVIPQAGAVGEWPNGLFEAEVRVAAFQNGYYAALVNRVGPEECIEFAGKSFVSDCEGQVVASAAEGKDDTLLADIDLSRVAESNARRLFFRDRRPELYKDLAVAEWR